nr:sensory neuron membrane protein 3 [Achelura yunnanensis]
MCNKTCSIVTTVIGVLLVIVACIISFVVVPNVINNTIINEVVLYNDTLQFERFEALPFALNFTVRIFNITNSDEVMQGGKPRLQELGPYIYKAYKTRRIEEIDDDTITFRGLDEFIFDPVGSYPNTEEDMITVVNVPYNAVIQIAERDFTELLGLMNNNLQSVFGEYNSPIITIPLRSLLWDGFRFCVNPNIIGSTICSIIKSVTVDSNNIIEQEDGSIIFSMFGFKDNNLGPKFRVGRGVASPSDLGWIFGINDRVYLDNWVNDGNQTSQCNMINGTDGALFAPFVENDNLIYAYNADICRSVTFRFHSDSEYEGIPVKKFTVNEKMYTNDEGCFCLNVTQGFNQDNGCLLSGAIELYSCVGAHLVLTNPHFLDADPTYINAVEGLNPDENIHRIAVNLEPNTGIVISGYSRAQFNMFLRPSTSIALTQNLTTTLTPIFWVEEGMDLPEDFVEEVTDKLLRPLRLVDILVPIAITASCVVLLIGAFCVYRARRKLV